MKCYVIKWIISFILLSLTVLICLKNGEIVIFVFWDFRFKPKYLKCYWFDFYENWHLLPENLVSTYSSVFFKFVSLVIKKIQKHKCRVRKVVRCIHFNCRFLFFVSYFNIKNHLRVCQQIRVQLINFHPSL